MDRRTMLGKINYAAYVVAIGGKTWDGRDAPPWENLIPKTQEGWTAGAEAACKAALPAEQEKEVPDGSQQ